MKTLPIIFFGVFLNAIAQLLLKAGTNKIGVINLSLDKAWGLLWQVAFNPFIFMGIACYVISVGVWIIALSRVDVSYAYPLLSVGYVLNAIAAYYLFGENLNTMRIGGIFVIILGVFMISRTA